jgi:hypothetical protein
MLLRLAWLWLIGVMGLVVLYLLYAEVMIPTHQEAMAQTQIYAYRGWQSTGIRLKTNETAAIRASGEWLYTPGEWHDANGHRRYPAPSFYPVPGVAGGVLLARIGENGTPQPVGKRGYLWAGEPGMLYLRINDDILSDNKGLLDVAIEVIPAPEPYGG